MSRISVAGKSGVPKEVQDNFQKLKVPLEWSQICLRQYNKFLDSLNAEFGF